MMLLHPLLRFRYAELDIGEDKQTDLNSKRISFHLVNL